MATIPIRGGVAMFARNSRPRRKRRRFFFYTVCFIALFVTSVVYSFNYYVDKHGNSHNQDTNTTKENPKGVPIDNPEQKITNNTLLIFKTYYSMEGCGHELIEQHRVSQGYDYLINKDEASFREHANRHLNAWKIKTFSQKEIMFVKEIKNRYCPNHYKIASNSQGYIVIYKSDNGKWKLVQTTEVPISMQKSEDKEKLKAGIIIYSLNWDDVMERVSSFDD